jgi:hypothetical protein
MLRKRKKYKLLVDKERFKDCFFEDDDSSDFIADALKKESSI